MKATYNYIHYVEPPVPKNAYLYKRTPPKISRILDNNKKYINDSAINIDQLKARASRYILDKKYRGELDTTSPRNKNVLIDTDSELTSNSRNTNKNTGCTKLLIEKIESQMPQINNEYYESKNQEENLNLNDDFDENQGFNFTKKNYVPQKISRCNSIIRNTNKLMYKNYSNSNFNHNHHKHYDQQPLREFNKYYIVNDNEYNYDYKSPLKKNINASTNNLFNSTNKFNQQLSYIKNADEKNKNNSAFLIKERNTSFNYKKYHHIFPKDKINNNNNINENINQRMFDTSYIPSKPNNMKFYKVNTTNNIHNNNNYNKNYKRGNNKDININPQENTLYENYQDLIKLNTFNRISQYNNNHRYLDNNGVKYSKINIYPNYNFNKKVIKLQSAWRGTYVRILMGFYWNLSGFKNTLDNIFKNRIRIYFLFFIKKLRNYSPNIKQRKKYFNIINNRYEKTNEEYIIELKQKEEDYENLLKNYNSLVERCTELEHLVNKNKTDEKKGRWTSSNRKRENLENINQKLIDIGKNKINFNENTHKDEKHSWRKLKIENNNVNLEIVIARKISDINNENNININKINEKKQFDLIEIEQKDKFDIITPNKIKEEIIIKSGQEQEKENNDKNNNNINLRSKYKQKKKEPYQNYIDNFTSNLSIINTEQFLIKENPKEKEKEVIIPLTVSKYEINLLNTDIELKELEHNNKTQKIFEIEKIKNNEIAIFGNEKENDNKKIKIDLVEENQKDLNVEIKGIPKNIINRKIIIEKKINIIINSKDKLKQKQMMNEISEVEKFDIISNKQEIKNKLFENEKLGKSNNTELIILGTKKLNKSKKIKKKKGKKQTKEDDEIKEIEVSKDIEESKDNEEIIKKENNLVEEVQKNSCIEIIGNNLLNHKIFSDNIWIDNTNSISIKRNSNKLEQKENEKEKAENTLANVEQFYLEGIYNINNLKNKNKNKNKDLVIEKVNNIIRYKNDKVKNNEIKKIELIPDININLFIKQFKKKTCEKMTEITSELNPILPCNNYELYIDRIIKRIIYINNKEQEISFIKKIDDGKNKIIYNSINLEIYKDDALEINPLMIKKSEISQENNIIIPFNKYSFFTEKAKKNMMKMILPIKLKTTLREFVQRNTFPLLIKYLKDIAKLKQK